MKNAKITNLIMEKPYVKGRINIVKRKYSTGYADYPGVGRITDEMIAVYRQSKAEA